MTIDLGIDGLTEYEEIGRGGSARVFRAWQSDLYRPVAVKVLHSSWDEAASRRFDRERQAMGRLSTHPGIVAVYATGATQEGSPYIVMPLYERGSLEHLLIKDGSLDWATATNYVLHIAATMADAHRYGILHRDLKPANILIGDDGHPTIADFGISTLADHISATFTSGLTFTPSFSPPEAFSTAASSTERDVYGLGATLWALIAGHAPFTEPGQAPDIQQIVGRVLAELPGDLRPLGVPDPVATVIERAMAKDPANRPADAQTFLHELQTATELAYAQPHAVPVVKEDQPGHTVQPENDIATDNTVRPESDVEPQHTIQQDPELVKPMAASMVTGESVAEEPLAIPEQFAAEYNPPMPEEAEGAAEAAADDTLGVPDLSTTALFQGGTSQDPTSQDSTSQIGLAEPIKPERQIAFVKAEPLPTAGWRRRNIGQVVGIAALIAALLGLFGAGAFALLGPTGTPSNNVRTDVVDRSPTTTEPSTSDTADTPDTEAPTTTTTAPSTTDAPTSSEESTTEAPVTQAPATQPPRTQPPQTQPPRTQAPTTRRPTTQAPTTATPTTAAPTTPAAPPPCPTWKPDCP